MVHAQPTTRPATARPASVSRRAAIATVLAAAGLVAAPHAPVAAAPTSAACAHASYAVEPGDSWFAIAGEAAVSVTALLRANSVDDATQLHPGDLICLPSEAVTASSCSPSNAPTYSVEPGDSWFRIAGRTGVTTGALLAANGADGDRIIRPGERLCLPGGAAAPTGTSTGRGGGSGSALRAGAGQGGTYTVVRGDSWFAIARRAGVSTRALLDANDASDTRVLFPGDDLRLPAGADPVDAEAGGAADSGATYTVVSGDSWYGIAERAGTTLGALRSANDSSRGELLLIGDVLRMPAGVAAPATRSGATGGAPRALQALPAHGPCWYSDTWQAPRAGGRRHLGVDLFTLTDAYVYAVADGRLTGRAWDTPGRASGNAWWLTADDGTVYFYAHLSDFAPGLGTGSRVEAGEIIGFVGGTGNASAPHLHFEIRPRGGAAINPYPTVRAGGGCKSGDGYRQPSGWTPDLD